MGHLRESAGKENDGLCRPNQGHGDLFEIGQSLRLLDCLRSRIIGGCRIKAFVRIYDFPIDGAQRIVLQ